MDKKSRLPQSSTKGTAGDAKKNQDITNGKVFPKTSRRREPTGAGSFSTNEPSRKSNAQKGKKFDKRPKPKGQYHGSSKEDTKVEDEQIAEHGSVMVQGSKKQNLNHLLNFHYEPRDIQGVLTTWGPGRVANKYNRNSNRWLPPVQRHKYNKEQFLQANCQFVVRCNGDYSVYLADPDILVEWNLIEQIRVHSSDILSCPICLSPPVAGKMTRCGHVYCWPCILHYLALSDKPWRKCPICYESIHKSDLKSMVEVTQKAWNIGDNVSLRLMRRERGSLIAVPINHSVESSVPTTFFNFLEDTSSRVYSKLLLADSSKIMDIIECERIQLKFEKEEDQNSPENCFIDQALDELLVREQQLFDQGKILTTEVVSPTDNGEERFTVKSGDSYIKGEEIETHDQVNAAPEDKSELQEEWSTESGSSFSPEFTEPACDEQPSSTVSKFFYFYQAEDGQNIYLHAMNVKMLELQYGSLDKCPSIISGKLLEKEAGSMTEELRRRMRYLHHLPLTCQFEIAEIELKPPIISKCNLSFFSEQLETRRKRRQRQEREERRRERKIQDEENKRMGRYPTSNVHIESRRHFPQWPDSPSSGISIPSPPESVTTSSIASSPSTNTFDVDSVIPDLNSWSTESNEQGPSFAQMLRTSSTRPPKLDWPSVHTLPSTRRDGETIFEGSDIEGYVPAPSYSQSFGDALAEALDRTELADVALKSTGGGNGKKKKKSKPKVLFATSMARSS